MRRFHLVILAYCFVCIGCGFKTTPVWREAPKQEIGSNQEDKNTSKEVSKQTALKK